MSVPTTRLSRSSFSNMKTTNDFKTAVYQTLAKFGDNSTLKYAQDEIRELMAEHITDSERMNTFIHLISDVSEQLKPMQKKEHFRIFGLLGEIFGENVIPFMPKILQFYQKKFKDIDPSLSQALADSMGVLIHYMLKNLQNKEESIDQLKIILRELHQNIVSSIKLQQVTAALCLAKVIQNSPSESIKKILPKLANRINEEINNPNTKCKAQILECLISIVLSIEKEFQPFVKQFLPFVIECADSKDQDTKKMAIDVIYTVAAILPPTLAPFKDHLVEVLNESRFDKQKPIREATIEAISALKDLPPGKQERIARSDGVDKKASREDPTPRPKEMPQEKFDIQAEKKGEKGAKQSPKGAGRQVTAVTQKKLMTARIMKSKSPVRKIQSQAIQDNQQKTSIFKGPVNKEFFKKVEKLENGIEIVTAQNEENEEEQEQIEEDESPRQEESPRNDTIEQEKSPGYQQQQQQTKKFDEYEEEDFQGKTNLSLVNKGNRDRDSRNLSRKESETNIKQQQYTQSLNYQESFKRSPSKEKLESVTGIYPDTSKKMPRYSSPQTQLAGGYQQQPQYQMQAEQYQQQEAESGIDHNSFNNSLNYIFYELDKISTQQLRMMESMNSFQNFTRNEIDYLKSKISTIETSVDELLRTGPSYQDETRQTFGNKNASPGYYGGAGTGNYGLNTTREYQQYNDYTAGGAAGYQSYRQNPNISMQQQSLILKQQNLTTPLRDTFGQASPPEWTRIQQLLNDNDYNEAYSQVLMRSKDEMLLIKLMGKTGVCLHTLSKSVLDYLVQKMIDLIQKRDFLNVIIVWVQELSNKLIEDQYLLNYNTTITFIENLKRLSEDFNSSIPSQVRQIAKQSHDSLSQAFKFF